MQEYTTSCFLFMFLECNSILFYIYTQIDTLNEFFKYSNIDNSDNEYIMKFENLSFTPQGGTLSYLNERNTSYIFLISY